MREVTIISPFPAICPEQTAFETPTACYSILRLTITAGLLNFQSASSTCRAASSAKKFGSPAEIALITSIAVESSIQQAVNATAYVHRNFTESNAFVWAAVTAHRTTLDNGTFRYLDTTNKTIKSNEVASAGEKGADVVACVLFSRKNNYKLTFHDCTDSAGTAVVCVTRKRKQDMHTLLPNGQVTVNISLFPAPT